MHWRRLIQPRKPAFWLMLALNALSTALMWIVQHYPLTALASLVIAVFAFANACLGVRLAWQLLSTPPSPPPH
ncbi:MAG: hypothetical protein K2X79_07115 [Burkholderiaceae bacterium]|nr:hypothetical protein [Burkholderiaceae bacterium]